MLKLLADFEKNIGIAKREFDDEEDEIKFLIKNQLKEVHNSC
jgi:hypothetical protein